MTYLDSKNRILQQTTQENIYLKFLGLTEFPKSNISSPFTTDKNPSFTLYKNGSFKCNSSGYQGDVFQFVAYLKQFDCKTQFKDVCNIIVDELQLNLNSVATTHTQKKPIKTTENTVNNGIATNLQQNCNEIITELQPDLVPNIAKSLHIEKREFTELDLHWWDNLGVSKEILERYKVHSIKSYHWTGGKLFYTKIEAVAFAYEFQGQIKLYVPEQATVGVKKNVLPPFKTGIFGLEQLGTEKKENLIICEGEKDTITATSRGFNAVCFGSATKNINATDIELLQSHCTNLFICYDNDDTGVKTSQEITKRFKNIIRLQLPQNENNPKFDITDYFQEKANADFQKIIDLAVKNKSVVEVTNVREDEDLTIFHKAENYILKKYDIRLDIIASQVQISNKGANLWKELNDTSLYVEMKKQHIKIAIGDLRALISSEFVKEHNPIKDYFNELPIWDKKTDFIKQFLDYVELEEGEDKEQFIYHFRKWCVRSVKCSTIEGYFNKQAFILSDDAKGQNIGKSTFLRYLVPTKLNDYYCENLPDDKDAVKRLGQNFIINLDELATLSKTDINKLKSMFSADKIKTRLPYGKRDIIISRVANFIGSTNMSTFLSDESGSVRWICFTIKKIDFRYSTNFDITNLWSQAFALSKDENFKEAMTVDDIAKNEIRNEKYQIVTPERDLIPKYFSVPLENDFKEFLNATDIVHYISIYTAGVRITNINIGKSMEKCGFTRIKTKGLYGYWVCKKPIAT